MRIAIAAPALMDNTGHNLNYALSLTDEFRSRGHSVSLFGNLHLSATLRWKFGVEPIFSVGFYESDLTGVKLMHPDGRPFWLTAAYSLLNIIVPRRSWRRRLRSALNGTLLVRQTDRDFRSMHAMMQFTNQDLLLLNGVNAIFALGFTRWLSGLPHDRRPFTILIVQYAAQREAYDHSCAIGRWRTFFAERRAAKLESKILFIADTTELARDFETISGPTIMVAPIPHGSNIAGRPPLRKAGHPFTVVYAGVGTETKGFHLLPEIVEGVADLMERGEIAFRIQANILDHSADMLRAIAILRKLKIELIEGPVEPTAYYDLLTNAAILLQPHDPSYYQLQSSGVFAEGRGAGLVAIVPAQTTMAQEISRAGGGVVVGGRTAGAYVDALRYCVHHFGQLASEARDAAPIWRNIHSPKGFTKALNAILPPTHQL
jgi:hypothetical protein